ncbi:hypothetical protein [Lentzea aerocolonigenes]|uniref:hypothetical protein n=1 Tax=Lentzea aerocolonigenes TaxID=68170 RepID=UPI0004C3EAAB|nr:hypothetical protein [Lentzea aerocolonigenes]MCP2243520.1 hypothetical protein [Lentzea aerocolonigenes]
MTTPAARIAREDGPAPEVDVIVIHTAIPRLRRALDRLDLPDDGPTMAPNDLYSEIIVGRVRCPTYTRREVAKMDRLVERLAADIAPVTDLDVLIAQVESSTARV